MFVNKEVDRCNFFLSNYDRTFHRLSHQHWVTMEPAQYATHLCEPPVGNVVDTLYNVNVGSIL